MENIGRIIYRKFVKSVYTVDYVFCFVTPLRYFVNMHFELGFCNKKKLPNRNDGDCEYLKTKKKNFLQFLFVVIFIFFVFTGCKRTISHLLIFKRTFIYISLSNVTFHFALFCFMRSRFHTHIILCVYKTTFKEKRNEKEDEI